MADGRGEVVNEITNIKAEFLPLLTLSILLMIVYFFLLTAKFQSYNY